MASTVGRLFYRGQSAPPCGKILPLLQVWVFFLDTERDWKGMPTSSGFLFISPSNVPKQEDNSALDNAFFFFLLQRYISMICLLPSVLVKQNWCFPILQLEGWHSTAAELVQRKSVIEPAVQALSWDGAEADFQFYPQIHNRCKHFTLDQCLIKSSHRRGGWEESKLKVSLSIPVYHLLPCKGSNCKGL